MVVVVGEGGRNWMKTIALEQDFLCRITLIIYCYLLYNYSVPKALDNQV